ncbi:MAG: hypothetical protein WDN03_12340 [Rhizomicrobium sp.]
MAIADSAATAKFEIGRVATRTFTVVRANFFAFFVLGLIATLPTTIYAIAATANIVPGAAAAIAKGGSALAWLIGVGVSAFVGFLFAFILQAAVTYGTIGYLSNQPVVLGRALMIGLREILPLFAIALLEGLGVGLGFVLLIVPGIMLYVMWSVVVPIRIAEHTGIFAAFGRSRELTRGHRWPVFGTLVVFYLGAGIAQTTTRPVLALGVATRMAGSVGNSLASPQFYVLGAINLLVSAIIAVVSATLIACVYYELRLVKEGVGPEQIAAVFD